MKIVGVRTDHDGWLKLVTASVQAPDGALLTREFITPRPAAAVLPFDPERRAALLVAQARPAVIHAGGPETLIEAAAGQVYDGERDEDAARREAMEELGVRLGALEKIADAWTSPGPSAERISLFLAPYAAGDRLGPGGGVPSEHETLTVMETPLAKLWATLEAGDIRDLKTLALIFALKLRSPELFTGE